MCTMSTVSECSLASLVPFLVPVVSLVVVVAEHAGLSRMD